jgi:3-methylcrotonyl-CoA carboxylase alpha subunit
MVETLGNGRFRVDGRLAYAARGRRSTWVFMDGSTYVIEPDSRDASNRVHVADDQMALSAPMPATVVAISVTPGQDVATGDLLVMLEAMKMELPIRAPRAGRVKTLACRVGELVQPGVPLVEMD